VVDLFDENKDSKGNFCLMNKISSNKKKPVVMTGKDISSIF
jgi:hypothetical protein